MEKIKRIINSIMSSIESEKGKDILIVIIVILVGLGSFELGRLSKNSKNGGIQIEYLNKDANGPEGQKASAISSLNSLKVSPINSNSTGKSFFASSRGSKYYPVGCSAGKSIVQENRIYFTSREEAEGAGYQLSSSCK